MKQLIFFLLLFSSSIILADSLIGKKFPVLTMAGEPLKSATITEVTDLGVKVTHSTGISRFDWDDLSAKHKSALGFDAEAYAKAKRALEEQEFRATRSFVRVPAPVSHPTPEKSPSNTKPQSVDLVKRAQLIYKIQDEIEALEKKYEKEDLWNANGGSKIKTSQANRKRALSVWQRRLKLAYNLPTSTDEVKGE